MTAASAEGIDGPAACTTAKLEARRPRPIRFFKNSTANADEIRATPAGSSHSPVSKPDDNCNANQPDNGEHRRVGTDEHRDERNSIEEPGSVLGNVGHDLTVDVDCSVHV